MADTRESSQFDNFEDKIKFIKAKHMSRDFDSEMKEENELQRRQRLLVNPKLKWLVSLFDNCTSKEIEKGSYNDKLKGISKVNHIPRNFYESKNDPDMVNFNKTMAQENRISSKSPIEVKDKLKALKISLFSERNDKDNDYEAGGRYEAIKAKRPFCPSATDSTKKDRTTTFRDDFKATIDKFNKVTTSNHKRTLSDRFFSPSNTTAIKDEFYQVKKNEIVNLLSIGGSGHSGNRFIKTWEENKKLGENTHKPVNGYDHNTVSVKKTHRRGFSMKNDSYFNTNKNEKKYETGLFGSINRAIY
jgi:hypothetical protein